MTELSSWNFTVQPLDLEPETAYRDLAAHLLSLRYEGVEDSLVIVYYGGHGGQDEDKDAVWYWYVTLEVTHLTSNLSVSWSLWLTFWHLSAVTNQSGLVKMKKTPVSTGPASSGFYFTI